MYFNRLIFLLGLLCSVQVACGADRNFDCVDVAKSFLHSPSQETMMALAAANHGTCWGGAIKSNADLNQLTLSVRMGNVWAASYMAVNLGSLGGGNLEDALISLGEFSDRNMPGLLIFLRKNLISKSQLSDALTMLPLSVSDDPKAQIALLNSRRRKLELIERPDLFSEKQSALRSIDAFVTEIKEAMSGGL